MYQSFGKTKSWQRILLPSIILIGLFSLPATVWLISHLLTNINIENLLVTMLFIFAAVYFPIKHVSDLYTFPFIEIDDNFMVLTQSFQSRSVYTLNQITSVKAFMKSVFFVHNGFPVLINVHTLTDRERKHLLDVIEASGSSSQHHNVDTVC
ncbi:MAG: hypothetical protein V3U88_05005 [Methylococcales bacterium]